MFKAESCGGCGTHPSVWKDDPNAVVAVWKHCRVCELIEAAREAGPPSDDHGWHLTTQHQHDHN